MSDKGIVGELAVMAVRAAIRALSRERPRNSFRLPKPLSKSGKGGGLMIAIAHDNLRGRPEARAVHSLTSFAGQQRSAGRPHI